MHRGANSIADLKRISSREMRFDRKGRGEGTKTFRAFIFIRVPRKIFWIDPLPPNYGIGFHRSARATIVTNGYINSEFCKRIAIVNNPIPDFEKYPLYSIFCGCIRISTRKFSNLYINLSIIFPEKKKRRKKYRKWKHQHGTQARMRHGSISFV